MSTWRVDASFYVEADSAQSAEVALSSYMTQAMRAVSDDARSVLGEIDIHEGDTQEWDLNT